MWNPYYFNGSDAVHGLASVPAYPASHGCARIPMHIADYFYTLVHQGESVFVVGHAEEGGQRLRRPHAHDGAQDHDDHRRAEDLDDRTEDHQHGPAQDLDDDRHDGHDEAHDADHQEAVTPPGPPNGRTSRELRAGVTSGRYELNAASPMIGAAERLASEAAIEGLVREVEDPAVGRGHQVAVAERDQTVDRAVEVGGAHRAPERRREREHAAVGTNQPVALAVGGR